MKHSFLVSSEKITRTRICRARIKMLRWRPGVVVHTCNLSNLRGGDGRIEA
jgi:hypothetical protein